MKKNLRCHVLWVMGFLLIQFGALAQTNTITGTVTAATDNMALPGVNVLIKGQTKGTVTDSDGKYSIEAGTSDILVFSFIGMETQEQPVGTQSNVNVSLFESLASLGEVVVVGYGTQKRSDITGAISTVDVSKAFESRPITDAGRALQGTTPGLAITSTSGALGGSPTIRIRGSVGTIASAPLGVGSGTGNGSALILVDNVEVPDMSYVNPDDIESISVLKDASTTAIYGARAAFGAILITTKKGNKDGKVKVSYSNNFSWGTPTKVPEMSRADWNLQYSWDMANAVGATIPPSRSNGVGYDYSPAQIQKTREWIETYGDGAGLGREMVEGRDFDYRPEGGMFFYRPWDINDIYYKKWMPQQNQNISVSGGNDKTQYSFSGAYMNQEGILKLFPDYYKRLNATGAFSTEVNKWLTVRAGFMYGQMSEANPFTYNTGAVYDAQFYLYRWHPVYPYGTYNGNEFRGGLADLKYARPEDDVTNYTRYNAGITVNLLPGLSANLDYTLNQTLNTLDRVGGYVYGIDNWTIGTKKLDDVTGYYTPSTYDYVQNTSARTMRNTYNAYLTYEKRFKEHNLKAMVGTNVEDSEYKYISARRNGVYDFDKGEIKLAGGDQIAASSHTWWSIAGVFARLNYSFKNKYLLEVNGRYDGTSKFASGRRSGFFPSASAGWHISEEPWMDALKPLLSSAKLRASYGEVGNQDVPLNRYIPTYPIINPTASDNEHWLIKNAYVPYIRDRNTYAATSPALTDPSLTWETVSTLDFGLDAGLFDDKLGVTVDWYQRKTTNMLTDGEVLPATVGADPALRNFGELTTNGIEIALNYRHTFDNGIRLTLSGNFTDYKTEITKFPTGPETLLTASYYEGKYTGDIIGFRTEGLYQREDFVWNDDNTIRPYTDENKVIRNTVAEGVPNQYALETTPNNFKFGPGDVRYADLNGDGIISLGNSTLSNPGDRTVIGNSTPRYQYGFRIGAEWKGFDLGLFFQGVGKREIWATGNMVLPGYVGTEANFAHTLDYWAPDNTDAFYPRPVNHGNTANRWNYWPTDRYMLNGAYLRMKNLTVGYTIPTTLVNKIHIERLRIYFSGENLFEFDKMGDVPIDPEIDWTLSNLNDARTFGRTYPYRRVLSFGLQLQF